MSVTTLAFFLLGLIGLLGGAELLLRAASRLAALFGMRPIIIGLAVVSLGTSLPELATTLLATWRGERDVAIGNLIGSSLYNILAILAVASLAATPALAVSQDILRRDIPVMLGIAGLCWLTFFGQHTLSRTEGALWVVSASGYFALLAASSEGVGSLCHQLGFGNLGSHQSIAAPTAKTPMWVISARS